MKKFHTKIALSFYRLGSNRRKPFRDYPNKYVIHITTDSQQWGGLSECTPEEAKSWNKVCGKRKENNRLL
jgi:deoxyhypusine synthase